MAPKPVPLEQRFWRYVRKTEACWLWTGATTNGGYGVIQEGPRGGKLIRAHRLSWRMHTGQDAPADLDLCHTCDTPPCVRPDHLFLGTAKQNTADMITKGRGNWRGLKGEDHNRAKLTEPKVIAIRMRYAAGGTSLNKLGAEFGVSKRMVLNIVHRKAWTHVK